MEYSINRYRSVVSVVFSYACREYDLPENPVRKIPSLPENNERIRFLSEAERTRLFKACRASKWDKLYLIVLLAITTGARKGEITKLRWNDIDFDRRTAYVATTKNGQPKRCQTITYFGFKKNDLKFFVLKNNLLGIDRIVPIGNALDIKIIWDGYDVIQSLSRIITIE